MARPSLLHQTRGPGWRLYCLLERRELGAPTERAPTDRASPVAARPVAQIRLHSWAPSVSFCLSLALCVQGDEPLVEMG